MKTQAYKSSVTKKGDDFKRNQRKKRKFEETYIPGHHETHLQWDGYSGWSDIPLFPGFKTIPLQNVPIKVRRLCHITHNQPAREIQEIKRDYCVFRPKAKYGKAGYGNFDGSPVGETFEMYEPTEELPTVRTEYKHVDKAMKLLPGYYIWWSIDCSSQNISIGNSCYAPSDVFAKPSRSRYGNNVFSLKILDLLQSYQKACSTPNRCLPRVMFRNGGTLRYRYEICYVVIVCTEESPLDREKYPVMWSDVIRSYRKLDGQLNHIDPIRVTVKNGIRRTRNEKGKKKFTDYFWDTFAFAFYFPSKSYQLECPVRYIEQSTVQHTFCTNSQPINGVRSYRYVCPNELPPVKRSRESIESEDEENEDGETIDLKDRHKRKRHSRNGSSAAKRHQKLAIVN